MQIKFLGAAGTVTGSSYVLTSGSGQSILIDLGMFQGTDEINNLNFKKYEYDTSQLFAAILTHAHLDHCGRLPIILKGGFDGDIWMTAPTADLTELSLFDSAKIARQDKKNALYDKQLVEKTIRHFAITEYGKTQEIGHFRVTFRDAGHILGSASLEIEDLHPNSEIKKIVFSGDLGNSPEDLVPPTEFINSAEAVVMESTYGDRLHPDEEPSDILAAEINAAETSKGTLLIPAFSLERTQEILHRINHLQQEGQITGNMPVYLDGPMAEKATAIYLSYPNLFNQHIKKEILEGNPFDFAGMHIVSSHEESQHLQISSEPKVIIAGSGMMNGGRIVGHAARFLSLPTTRLLIVGFQGEETLGRELEEGAKEVTIDGVGITVRAQIAETKAMSSHADQNQLLDWLKHIKGVKKLFITHGENEPRKVLAEKVKQELKISDIELPNLNQEISF